VSREETRDSRVPAAIHARYFQIRFKMSVTARPAFCAFIIKIHCRAFLEGIYCGPRRIKTYFHNFCIIALFLLTHESRILLNKA
jgi:hypothetical protein